MIRASSIPAERAAGKLIGLPERALSLTWPWPHFMFVLGEPHRKKIENRKLGFSHKSFRGECWVHCTAPKTKRDYYWALDFAMEQGVPRVAMPPMASPWIGCIIGRWNVVGPLDPPDPNALPDRWRMVDQIGFVIESARVVQPVKCRGALGFWKVPADVLAKLAATQRDETRAV